MEYDLKDSFHRIGHYKNTYLKIARFTLFVGIIGMAVLLVDTALTNHASARLNYQANLKAVIYKNIRHK